MQARARARALILSLALALSFISIGCAGLAGSSGGATPPGNVTVPVTVAITPTSAPLLLGETANFSATVSGTSNPAVSWAVNGIAGGNAQVGTISASGQFIAPQILPSPASVTITATAQADTNATASATVTITSDVAVGVAPTSETLAPGAAQTFSATITSAGNPTAAVTWSVDGVAGGNATIGTITSTGVGIATYVAPAAVPSPPGVTVTATSVADISKSASATIIIACWLPARISPSTASVSLGQSQIFTASLCAAPGTAIVWDVNGVVGGSAALGTIAPAGANTANYLAPADLPATNPLTIHATVAAQSAAATVAAQSAAATAAAQAAETQSAAAIVTIFSNVAVSVNPPSATVVAGGRATFSAIVTNTPDATVTWSVDGAANGNATAGEVCITGTNPCQPPNGASSASVDYLAPANAPAGGAVVLMATSHADPSRSGSAQIAVTPASATVAVTIFPAYAFLPPSNASPSQFQFMARVTGSGNTSVTWSVTSGVSGSGCGGTACGTISAAGLYTAPSNAPSPNAISVIATSVANPAQSATASVAITSGATSGTTSGTAIEQILPSSVMAGVASSFTLTVNGAGFVAGEGEGASAILVNGAARSTVCQTVLTCSTALQPSDVSAAGTLTIQIQNPGEPGPLSNPVPFIVVPFTLTQNVIALSASAPASIGNSIVVYEPTTAGVTTAQINVDFAGPISADGACNFDSSPIEVALPASGTTATSICVHGNALDPTFLYEFTEPTTPDISVSTASLDSLFPNLVQLNLTISSATLPGVRSLFISTTNNDRAVATGLLEVQ